MSTETRPNSCRSLAEAVSVSLCSPSSEVLPAPSAKVCRWGSMSVGVEDIYKPDCKPDEVFYMRDAFKFCHQCGGRLEIYKVY